MKGGTYFGTIRQGNVIFSFHVSKNGKKVTDFSVDALPAFCESGGLFASADINDAAVRGNGRFRATGTGKSFRGEPVASVVVTGKFLPRKKARGTVKVTYLESEDCSGTSSFATAAA